MLWSQQDKFAQLYQNLPKKDHQSKPTKQKNCEFNKIGTNYTKTKSFVNFTACDISLVYVKIPADGSPETISFGG